MGKIRNHIAGSVCMALAFFGITNISSGQTAGGKVIRFERDDAKHKVEVYAGNKLFTVYQYPSDKEKPFLFPVYAPDGSVITRGWPIEPRKGERTDHPHQFGVWFTHGVVNHLDFWGNSSAIPASQKDAYGHIVLRKIVRSEGGQTG